MNRVRRGHRLRKAIKDATRPIHVTAMSMFELVESQKSEGAYQKRVVGNARSTAAR